MTTATTRTRMFAVLALTGALALSACGKDGDSAPGNQDVASAHTGAASSAAATSTKSEAGRPQQRLDSSKEEEDRLWKAYQGCLKDNGVPKDSNAPSLVGTETLATGPQYKAAYDKCEIKLPLSPPEMDPKKNPHYADDMREWTKCMTAKGVPTHVTEDGWTFSGKPSVPPTQINKVIDECKMVAFGAKK